MAEHFMIIMAIGLLSTIFMASFVALLLICKKNKCGKADFNAQRLNDQKYFKQEVELIGARSASQSKESLELGTCWPNDLPDMFLDPDWNGDAEYLYSDDKYTFSPADYCAGIATLFSRSTLTRVILVFYAWTLLSNCVTLLKTCHQLTESLVVYTVENTALKASKYCMDKIVAASKQIGPKVDDLVQAMYTPSNSKQMEEKCSALYSSISHLLQVIKDASDKPVSSFSWADDIMQSITELMKAMKMAESSSVHSAPGNSNNSGCQQPTMSIVNKAFCA